MYRLFTIYFTHLAVFWGRNEAKVSSKGTMNEIVDLVFDPKDRGGPHSYEECAADLMSRFLTIEGVNFLIKEIANFEGNSPVEVIGTLSRLNGLHDGTLYAAPSETPVRVGTQDEIVKTPVTAHRVGTQDDVTAHRLLKFAPIPWIKTANGFEVVPPDSIPKALLILLSETGDVIRKKWVNLVPSTSLLDLLKLAGTDYASDGREISDASLKFKLKRLKSKGCLTISSIGHLRSSPSEPLKITVFNPLLQIEWESVCLPKVSDLLIYSEYVVVVSLFTK